MHPKIYSCVRQQIQNIALVFTIRLALLEEKVFIWVFIKVMGKECKHGCSMII